MMHNPLETCCTTCERAANRSLKSFDENLLTAVRDNAVKPASPDCHHHTPSLRWNIGQCSLVATMNTGRHGLADRAGGGRAKRSRGISNLSASVSMRSMASPQGARVIPRP
jgi:hypothetical protein